MSVAVNFEWANPRSLEQARKRLRLALEEVAEQAGKLGREYAGITAKALASWEAGTRQPELRHLEALSEIYVCPVGWFFLSAIPAEPLPFNFRGVVTASKIGALGMQTLARFKELADWAEDVAVRTGQLRVTSIEQASLQDGVEQLAAAERRRLGFHAQVRSEWETYDDAFAWWRRRIEGLGVFCFVMRLPASEVRGASHQGKHGSAFILVNSDDAEAATGRTFTLLHEYAHFLLRESLVCDFRGSREGAQVERFANRFAARMLLGRSEISTRLKELDVYQFQNEWGDSMLDRIREPFFVSRDVVSIYLEELELAPEGFYAKKRGIWAGRRGFGRSRTRRTGFTTPVRQLRKVGSTLAGVLSSEHAKSLSTLELAEALDVKVERVPAVLEAFRKAGGDV